MILTLASVSLRGLLNRRRTLLLGLFGALVVLVAVLFRLADQPADESLDFTGQLLGNFGLAVLLPVVAVAAGDGRVPAWWAIATGAVFGVAIHCTNVLPDLVDDEATGVRGFPHRLGLRLSGVVAFGSLVVAALLVSSLVGALIAVDALTLTAWSQGWCF